jgi:hypothetical protein
LTKEALFKSFAVLQLFRTYHIFTAILGFSFVFIWHSSIYFQIPDWEPSQSGILMKEVSSFLGHSDSTARVVVILLLSIQFGCANSIVNHYKLAETSTVFPGIFLILFSCYAPQFLFLSAFHFVNTIFIVILYILFNTYNQPKAADLLFNMGLLAGISFLFFPPTLYLIAIIFIGAGILRTYQLKERIIILIGFILPSFWVGLYYYWQGNLPVFFQYQFTHFFSRPQFALVNPGYISLVLYVVFAILFLYLILSYGNMVLRKNIQSRKRLNILFWSLGIILGVLFFLRLQGKEVYLLLVLPVSLLTSIGFESMNPKRAEIFHFILILGLLVSHYFTLFF